MRQLCLWIGLWGLFGWMHIQAQETPPPQPPPKVLIVGVHDKPPFAYLADGEWRGLGVDLWKMIAEQLGYHYRFKALPYEDLTDALVKNEVDVVVGELTVSANREELIDFSQPFLQTNILVAVNREHWRQNWFKIMWSSWDSNILWVIGGAMLALMIVAFLIWLAERRREGGHFAGRTHHGIGSAVWFAVVTMSGVGYGDKTPVTFAGRTITVLWIFSGLLLMTAFTATVASTVATAQTRSAMENVDSLKHRLNGVLDGSNAESILRGKGANVHTFESLETALADLANGKLDTVVGDGLSLRYLIHQNYPLTLHLLPLRLSLEHVALGLPQASPLREPINVALLESIATPHWTQLVNEYVGESPPNIP